LLTHATFYLAGKKYGKNNTRLTEANDGVAFAKIGTVENKGNKKKEIMC